MFGRKHFVIPKPFASSLFAQNWCLTVKTFNHKVVIFKRRVKLLSEDGQHNLLCTSKCIANALLFRAVFFNAWFVPTILTGCSMSKVTSFTMHVKSTYQLAFPEFVLTRLAGSSSSREGRLEVFNNSQWGSVCSDFFDNIDAIVACYGLGFGWVSSFICSALEAVLR